MVHILHHPHQLKFGLMINKLRKMAFIGLLFTGSAAMAQVGKVFPELTGETLESTKKSIPASTKGKYTIICMAYSSDSENDLKTWLGPAYDKFIAKTEMFSYDVNLYFVPMFTGLNVAGAGKAKKDMIKDTDKELHPYVLFYTGEIDVYKKELGMDKKDLPYIFVLDKDGKIVYATNGYYTEAKMEALEDKLE
jgi:hypothetical protein